MDLMPLQNAISHAGVCSLHAFVMCLLVASGLSTIPARGQSEEAIRILEGPVLVPDPCAEFQSGGMPGLLEFASPNYPNKYPPAVNCMRLIQAPTGYDIVLRFVGVFEVGWRMLTGRMMHSPKPSHLDRICLWRTLRRPVCSIHLLPERLPRD